MKNPNEGMGLPPAVLQKLNQIRSEDRRVRFQTGLRRALAVFLAALLAAMIIDWLAVLHENGWRWALTLFALAFPVAMFIYGCFPPLLRRRSLASIARDVDRAHPSLEERFITLVEFAQCSDAPELRGSPAMLEEVARQAAALTGNVSARAVVPRTGLVRAGKYLAGSLAALLFLFMVNFQQTKVLFLRFWAPGADISLTRLATKPGDAIVGTGDDVTLEITETGKATESANLFLRGPDRDEIIPLTRDAAGEAIFLYTLDSVVDSFEYRVRAGDGQTAWHSVTVMERPKISRVNLHIVAPAYSHLPAVEEEMLPRHVRALEGSQMEVSFQSDQPLAGMELKLSDGKSLRLPESADHTYHFNTALTNTLTFTPVLNSLHHLDNAAKPTCEVVVYPDQPPTVTVLSPENQITARHDDKVKIEFVARDDFGVAKAELVATIQNDTNAMEVVIPIPFDKNEAGAKRVQKVVELDLGKFNLKQDQEVSYFVRVTDTKENAAQSTPNPSESVRQGGSAQNEPASGKPPGDGKKHLAMNAPAPPKDPEESPGSKPPPNNMTKRVLDAAGQCSCCSPMKIIVDDWGRSFEGQARDKLEIAIDPVLQLLDSLLRRAGQLTDTTLDTGRTAEGLSNKQSPAMQSARDALRRADSAVTDLKKTTYNTPYAFIGLQLDDIRDAHISPARKNLGAVTLQSGALREDMTNLEQGSFQIKRARERLAELKKTYTAVKRDNKLADAMQRLAKMHQIFLEDTQAMLGSSPPSLNPQQRKMAEVSDQFAEKLRKLLEEKKKILAELAKILADDPRLLRRFMALQELEGTTLRDQMTLLAGRQQTLAKESAQWNASATTDRAALLKGFLATQAAEQGEVAAMASKLLENIVTWTPLDVSADKEPIPTCRKLAAEAARLAGEGSAQTTPETLDAGLNTASNALDQLRHLQATLPGLTRLTESRENVSVFAANRLNETAELITRESGWIRKIQALRAGDYAPAAEVDQHRLMLDTTALGEKLDTAAASVDSLSAEIKAKAEQLNGTMRWQILPNESKATDALGRKTVQEAAGYQAEATNAFARGEKRFDELLRLIIAKLDAEPPPDDPAANETLSQMLAELQEEQKACEKLGVPCRPINVQLLRDWLKPGSCSNPVEAQALAAAAEARAAKERAERNRDNAKQLVLKEVDELPPAEHAHPDAPGPKPPPTSWNTLVSQLGDELRQGRDTVPPEQYRQAIEQYFNTISEKSSEPPVAAGH